MTVPDEERPLLSPPRPSPAEADARPSSSKSNLTSAAISRSADNNIFPEASNLGRRLGWRSAYILAISRVIGSGIFATPGAVVRSAGSIGLSLLIWAVGFVIAGCGLMVSLEYGCMLPRSGGDKVYLEFVYRRPRFLASTFIAVQAVLLDFSSANCMVFSQYVLFAFGEGEATEFAQKGLAVALLSAVVAVHACLPRLGVVVQNVLGWIKIALVVFMILLSLFVVAFRRGHSVPERGEGSGWNELWIDSDWSWGTIATSLFKVFYAYAGLNNVNNVMNDVRDPVRTLRSVALSALGSAFVLYTLINLAYFIVVPLEDIKQSGELIAGLFFQRSFGPNVGEEAPSCCCCAVRRRQCDGCGLCDGG